MQAERESDSMIRVVFAGMVIIFVSVFFILSVFDAMIKANIECMQEADIIKCNLKEFSIYLIIGLLLIGLFILVDIAVVYVLIGFAFPKETFHILKNQQ